MTKSLWLEPAPGAQGLLLSLLSPQERFKGPLTLGELQNQELPHMSPYKAEEVLGPGNTGKGKCTKSHAKMQLSKENKQPKTKNLWQTNFR